MQQGVQNVCVSVLTTLVICCQMLLSYHVYVVNGTSAQWLLWFLQNYNEVSKPLQMNFVVVALQVLCVRSMRCKASGVDDGDPSAPRTEKTTAHECVLLSPRNQVYHNPQSSQVAYSVCLCIGNGFFWSK